MTALVVARDLVKHFLGRDGFGLTRTTVQAVDGVDLDVHAGETVALVGESGSGKSTVAQLLLRLVAPTSGRVEFDGHDLAAISRAELRALRRRMQIVFQDTNSSLNPRLRIDSAIAEPLRVHRGFSARDVRLRAGDLLERVGLSSTYARRFPHELSGGERQRASIARTLAVEPVFVVLDEPVSALDVSVQAGIVNLLGELQRDLDLAYVFISHDLAVVRHLAHRVAVMHLGRIVETGTRDEIYAAPAHPYTQALLSAVPNPVPARERARRRIVLHGDPPSPLAPPSGCRFRTRCWKAEEICAIDDPALTDRGQGHPVACHFAEALRVV